MESPAQDPEKDKYKNDGFARTDWVIPKREFDFQAHEWVQEGTLLICRNAGHPDHASPIAVDKMLIKENGEFKIVPLQTVTR